MLWILPLAWISCTCATSPWRLPYGDIQDAFQRPTFRPRSTTTMSPGLITLTTSANKSYKTFYRVFYGTPPPASRTHSLQTDQSRTRTQHLDSEETSKSQHLDSEEMRHRMLDRSSQELEDVRSANEHFLRVRTAFKCRDPAPRVLRVQDLHPDPSREYLPRCAVLHRCADDVGCCDNDAFHCVPRAVQEIQLAFYVLSVSLHPESPGLTNSIQKLMFDNHTECECQPFHDLPRYGVKNPPEHKHTTMTTNSTTEITSTTSSATTTTTTAATTTTTRGESTWKLSKCRECPVPFHRREYPDGRCSCDCFDKHKSCLKIKRGRESLSEVERRCVEASYCHIPECEYGDYDYDTGRCPKKPDHFRPSSKPYVSPAHRWNFFERD